MTKDRFARWVAVGIVMAAASGCASRDRVTLPLSLPTLQASAKPPDGPLWQSPTATFYGKSREQVKEELAQAIRKGELITGTTSSKRSEQTPWLYPSAGPAAP